MAMYEIGQGRMRRFGNGSTMSFRVEPPQPCYRATNVNTGFTRPHLHPHLWRSDPNQPLPQGVELSWETPQEIGQVELTFPGHLLREYHAYGPFYRDPQCAREYSLSAWQEGAWVEVLRVHDNYQRHRRHPLPQAVRTQKLRVTIHRTNGDPSAAMYEVRCYQERGMEG